jgi:hypothetical protein
MFSKKVITSIGLTTGLTLSTLVGVDRVQAASFTIDDFHQDTSNSQSVEVKKNDASLGSSQVFENNILGGYRDLALTNVTGFGNSNTKSASAEAISGRLAWNNDTSVYSDLTTTWDGNDSPTSLNTTGLGGQDITNNLTLDGIFIEIITPDETAADYGFVSFDIYDMNNQKYSLSQSIDDFIKVQGKSGLFFDFNQFQNGNISATKNIFQNVGAIQMKLGSNGNTSFGGGIDFEVALVEISIAPPPPKTPEPSLSLLVLAGIGLVGAKTKKK